MQMRLQMQERSAPTAQTRQTEPADPQAAAPAEQVGRVVLASRPDATAAAGQARNLVAPATAAAGEPAERFS